MNRMCCMGIAAPLALGLMTLATAAEAADGGFVTLPAVKAPKPLRIPQSAPGPGHEFTLRVPMNFTHLRPEITGIRLTCGVRKNGTTFNYTATKTVAPVNGSYQGTLVLGIDVTGKPDQKGQMHPELANADMNFYWCDVDLWAGATLILGPSDNPNDPPYKRVEPGTSHNTNSSGAIPW